MAESDFSRPCIIGNGPFAFPMRPGGSCRTVLTGRPEYVRLLNLRWQQSRTAEQRSEQARRAAAARWQSMKRLNGKVMAEPQPWLGGMSDAEFRHHTKDAYGF